MLERIAIIGSGISGLTAAYRLHPRYQITVFEANDYVGGHTNTVDVELEGERHSIDTGFVVFNDWTYPNFIRMLGELSVEWQPTTMSFSVRDDRSDLEYNGESFGSLFAQSRNFFRPVFYRMLADIWRFNSRAIRDTSHCGDEVTVGEFLAKHRYSRAFADQYLLPMGAAIWSCPIGTFAQFPIRFIVEFYRNHGLLSVTHWPTWRVISGGSRNYVAEITRGFRDRIRLDTPILRVIRRPDRVDVHPADRDLESFDHVIFACHSDQALRILGDNATRTERGILSEFPYGRNTAVLHTDISVFPHRRRAWASWNYRIHDGAESTAATITYNMNLLQGIRSQNTFCVTLNDESRIAPGKILRRFDYEHPIFTTRRSVAQSRHAELMNANRSSFCGAYWGNGFHEDGVNSALSVVNTINASHQVPRTGISTQCRAGVAR